jgi:hypothetical protein
MSKITLAPNAAGTATFTVAAPNTSTDRTLTLPDTSETLVAQGTALTLGTAVASTSGTAIDFTGIPAWAKRITVMFNGVSTSGTNSILIQLGSGTVQTSGYLTYSSNMGSASVSNGQNYTSGFGIAITSAAYITSGSAAFSTFGSSAWTGNGFFADSSGVNGFPLGGVVSLSGALDRIRITTVGGTDTFDAGSINIMYEG